MSRACGSDPPPDLPSPPQFLFHGGKVDKKFYMDNLQLESAKYDLISSPITVSACSNPVRTATCWTSTPRPQACTDHRRRRIMAAPALVLKGCCIYSRSMKRAGRPWGGC